MQILFYIKPQYTKIFNSSELRNRWSIKIEEFIKNSNFKFSKLVCQSPSKQFVFFRIDKLSKPKLN